MTSCVKNSVCKVGLLFGVDTHGPLECWIWGAVNISEIHFFLGFWGQKWGWALCILADYTQLYTVIFPTFHTSVKCRKITFNSYNYNVFCYFFSLVFINMFSLKLRIQFIKFHAFRLWRALWYVRRCHDVEKRRWQQDHIRQLIDMNTVN